MRSRSDLLDQALREHAAHIREIGRIQGLASELAYALDGLKNAAGDLANAPPFLTRAINRADMALDAYLAAKDADR